MSDGAAGNLNQDISVGFKIPLFGNPQLADPDNLYELVTPIPPEGNFKNIRVNAAGRYRVAVTLGLEAQEDGTGIDDNIVEVRLQITDVYGNVRFPGAFQHSTEMEGTASGQDDDGAVSFVEVIEINEDDVISVLSYQSSSTGNASVELNGSRPSSFYLIKIN
ncbi:hypothetical protein [uncultured Nonlabens sp.]|uniref:hypothetical protein n=1 Tax=uncultured Nonlabens sp. TaxID=859306 RepID=UPI002601F1A5|nr:hypothetical protein [uncultured Nonlabens sp.]